MKKQSLPLLVQLTVVLLLSLLISSQAWAYPSGSPAGYTGSPFDFGGRHCTSCHGGSAASVTGWITSNIPAQGYTSGTVYTITATVTGSGKKGFEVSPQSASGTQLGILTAGSNNHLVSGGTKYLTQNSSGSTSETVVYNFTWTAPAAGAGTVTFYGAFCVGKANTKLSTLVVNENLLSGMPDEAVQRFSMNIAPNPTHGTFAVTVSGVDLSDATVTVSDIRGKIVIRQILDGSDRRAVKFDLSGYAKGLYLVRVQTTKGSMVHKLINE
jgi:hypothetical protein